MKRIPQILMLLVAAATVAVIALIALIESLRSRADREVQQIVAQIGPGTPFSDVVRRLGHAAQTFTNADEIRVFGTTHELTIITNCILHAYGHRGPPYRWIVVYTDRQSERVLYADSKEL